MQRAAAAAAAKSAPENIEVLDAKRTKATIDSGLVSGLPAGASPPADMGAISAAVQEEEGKRAAAIERQAADAGETHWVIDFPASKTQETEHYHYEYILPGTEANVDALVDENRAGGRKRFGGYNKQESEKVGAKIMSRRLLTLFSQNPKSCLIHQRKRRRENVGTKTLLTMLLACPAAEEHSPSLKEMALRKKRARTK